MHHKPDNKVGLPAVLARLEKLGLTLTREDQPGYTWNRIYVTSDDWKVATIKVKDEFTFNLRWNKGPVNALYQTKYSCLYFYGFIPSDELIDEVTEKALDLSVAEWKEKKKWRDENPSRNGRPRLSSPSASKWFSRVLDQYIQDNPDKL